jgi:hypothetical protein
MNESTYSTLCQHCVYQLHPTMLTGYCIRAVKCDHCGRVADCALTRVALPDTEESEMERSRR